MYPNGLLPEVESLFYVSEHSSRATITDDTADAFRIEFGNRLVAEGNPIMSKSHHGTTMKLIESILDRLTMSSKTWLDFAEQWTVENNIGKANDELSQTAKTDAEVASDVNELGSFLDLMTRLVEFGVLQRFRRRKTTPTENTDTTSFEDTLISDMFQCVHDTVSTAVRHSAVRTGILYSDSDPLRLIKTYEDQQRKAVTTRHQLLGAMKKMKDNSKVLCSAKVVPLPFDLPDEEGDREELRAVFQDIVEPVVPEVLARIAVHSKAIRSILLKAVILA